MNRLKELTEWFKYNFITFNTSNKSKCRVPCFDVYSYENEVGIVMSCECVQTLCCVLKPLDYVRNYNHKAFIYMCFLNANNGVCLEKTLMSSLLFTAAQQN